jgi:hypothetical protein
MIGLTKKANGGIAQRKFNVNLALGLRNAKVEVAKRVLLDDEVRLTWRNVFQTVDGRVPIRRRVRGRRITQIVDVPVNQ